MFKLVTAVVLAGCCFLCSEASARGHGCNCPCSQPVAAAMPSMPGMPGMPAQTAANGQAYRTYSYQPTVAPSYRSTGRSARVAPHMNAGGHSAGFKQTDF